MFEGAGGEGVHNIYPIAEESRISVKNIKEKSEGSARTYQSHTDAYVSILAAKNHYNTIPPHAGNKNNVQIRERMKKKKTTTHRVSYRTVPCSRSK